MKALIRRRERRLLDIIIRIVNQKTLIDIQELQQTLLYRELIL
jgi:hypothetical protein